MKTNIVTIVKLFSHYLKSRQSQFVMPLDLETDCVHVGTVLVSGVRFVVCGCSMKYSFQILSIGPVVNLSKKIGKLESDL